MSRANLYQGPQLGIAGNAGWRRGRLPVSGDRNSWFTGGNRDRQDDPSLLDQMGQALSKDVTEIQGAEKEYREGLNKETDATRQFFAGVGDEVKGIGERAQAFLEPEARSLTQAGDSVVTDFLGRSNSVLSDLEANHGRVRNLWGDLVGATEADTQQAIDLAEGGITAAREYGERAIGLAASAASKFGESRIAAIHDTTAGIERRAKNDIRMMESGQRADGTMMSPAELSEFRREKQFDLMQATGSVAAQINAEYDAKQADLDMAVAQITSVTGGQVSEASGRAAGVALGAAELRQRAREGQAGAEERMTGETTAAQLALSGQGLEAERIRASYRQLATGVRETQAQIAQAVPLAGLNLRAQGFTTLFDMVSRNPRQPVSIFAALAEMAKVATAPGGRAARGIGGLEGLGIQGPSSRTGGGLFGRSR